MNQHRLKLLLLLLMSTVLFIVACKKADNPLDHGPKGPQARVKINMQGISATPKNNSQLRASTKTSGRSSHIQSRQLSLGNMQLTATLQNLNQFAEKKALRASAKRAADESPTPTPPQALANGTMYWVHIYEGPVNGSPLASHSFIQGQSEPTTFDLAIGTYTVVTTAYAHAEAAVGSPDRDPLAAVQTFTVQAETDNVLNIVLQHQLTAITVIFDATIAGNISSINHGTISPNSDYTFNEQTGAINFGSQQAAKTFNFANQSGSIWTSPSTLIATEQTLDGRITLNGVTINGKTGDAVSHGWTFQPGVKYALKISVRPPDVVVLPDLPIYSASGNLIGNSKNNRTLTDHQYELGSVYNGNGSQSYCEEALGTGWVTPSSAIFTEIMSKGYVRGTYAGQSGWFFGTAILEKTIIAPENYLFLPDNISIIEPHSSQTHILPEGSVGAYWTGDNVQGSNKPALILYTDKIQIAGIQQTNTVGIRCVKELD